MKSPNRRLAGILIVIAVLLAVPFIAMHFTNEVNWSVMDFTVAGGMLLVTGLSCEIVLRAVRNLKYRFVICLVILILFILTWLELAIGVFGSPFSGN